jgi:hypothetical protein
MCPTRASSLEPSTSILNRLVATIRKSRLPWKKVVLVTIALAIWCAILWRVVVVFNPSTMLGVFSSDGAIPVLMSNDDRPITIFNLYYYGAGRWGGWPFLFAQVARWTTGYRWTDQSLFLAQAVSVLLGAMIIAGLSRKDRLPVALIYLLTICLHGAVSRRLFDISQVYSWQITSLLVAWCCLRRFLSKGNHSTLRHVAWGVLTLWFSFLSIWSSLVSTPMLFFLFGLEGLWAYLRGKKEREGRLPLRRYIWAGSLAVAAALAELLMRRNYYRYNLKHFGADYRTRLTLDVGYLTQNLDRQLQNFVKYPWWPLCLLALLFLFASGFAFLYAKKKKDLLAPFREVFVDDLLILIIGSLGIAVMNFVLIVLANHVRINLYDDRFMTPTYLFGSISGLLAVFLILKLATNQSTFRKYARPGFIVAGLVFLTVEFPPQTHSSLYETDKETAIILEKMAPRAVLMGGYWQTYVFSGLQSENGLTPVPLEGQTLRTPWTPEALRITNQVIVEYRASNFGSAESLPPRLSQYGTSLRLAEPRWYQNQQYAFALYLREDR